MQANLQKVLKDILKLPEVSITSDLRFKDVPRWDSFKHIELVIGIEAAFEINLEADDIASIVCVSDVERILRVKKG